MIEQHSVRVPESGEPDWPRTIPEPIVDRDTGDETSDPVIRICRRELAEKGQVAA